MRVDWHWVMVTGLWVLGCAIILSVISIVYASASFQEQKFLSALHKPKPMNWILIGSLIGLFGVIFTQVPVQQKLFWCVTVAWIGVETVLVWRQNWPKQPK